MISKKVNSVQEWLPVDEILENGIIKVKNKNYINENKPVIQIERIFFNSLFKDCPIKRSKYPCPNVFGQHFLISEVFIRQIFGLENTI